MLFCVVLLEIEIRNLHPHPAFPLTNSVESEPKEMSDAMDGSEAILREGFGLRLALSREELGQKAAREGREACRFSQHI